MAGSNQYIIVYFEGLSEPQNPLLLSDQLMISQDGINANKITFQHLLDFITENLPTPKSSLSDLEDTQIGTTVLNDVLTIGPDGKWINKQLNITSSLEELNDTTIVSKAADDVLAYDEATNKWVNRQVIPPGDRKTSYSTYIRETPSVDEYLVEIIVPQDTKFTFDNESIFVSLKDAPLNDNAVIEVHHNGTDIGSITFMMNSVTPQIVITYTEFVKGDTLGFFNTYHGEGFKRLSITVIGEVM